MTAIVTRSARIWLDPEGIIQEVDLPGCDQSLQDAKDNVAANRAVAGGERRPLLVDMVRVRSISREARDYYGGSDACEVISAAALLVGSPLSRMIGNFFLGLNRPAMPVRLFTSCDEARTWLLAFLPAQREAA